MSVIYFKDVIYKIDVMFVTTPVSWRETVEWYGHAGLAYPRHGAAQCTRLSFAKSSPVVLITANRAALRRAGHAAIAEVCAHEATHVMRFVCENVCEDFLGWEAEAHLVGAVAKWMWKIVVDGAVN
jgi:hypothetical protein